MKKVITTLCLILGLIPSMAAQNGLDFDGTNDLVETTYSGVLGSLNRTFEAWVFVSSSAPSSNLAILDYGLNATGSRNTFCVSGTRQLLFLSGGTNANISTTANAVPVGQWAHVALVLDSGTGYLYVNGVQMGTGSLTTVNTPSNGQSVRVGSRVTGGNIRFNGSIDEVRIWDVAKTATEIQAKMNSELCGQDANLQLYLKFNEGTAGAMNTGVTTAKDDSGNNNDGTLTSFNLTGATSNWVNGSGIAAGGGSSTSSLQQSACGSFSLTPTSTVYTTSGIYTETLAGANAAGCDSIVTLDLTISSSTSGTDVQTACDSFVWIDGNTFIFSNNLATYTLINAAGCDSVVTLDLTIINSNSVNDVQTACNSYTWIDGNTYTSSNNTATYTLTNMSGCDSIVTLDLTIDSLNVSVTTNDAILTANESGATYQWLECPAMTPISGAISQSYTATTSGDYAVIVTTNQCSDTSDCYNVTMVGTNENEFTNSLELFPNPTNGAFSIDLGETYSTTTVTVMDLTGKLILSNTYDNTQLLNLELNEPAGVYLLMVETADKKAIIRLVKN